MINPTNRKPHEIKHENRNPYSPCSDPLQAHLRTFFLNFSPEVVEQILWQLYKGWAYQSAEYADKEDIREMLDFYEQLRELMEGMVVEEIIKE